MHSAGDTLLHTDVRADNLLLTADGEVVVVDWPHACRGSAFVELVLFAPSVAMQGGPQLADLLAMSPAGRRCARSRPHRAKWRGAGSPASSEHREAVS